MQILFSLLYAPLVFFSLQYFDIKSVSIFVFFISLLWFSLLKNKKAFSAVFPLFYMLFSFSAFFTEEFFVLKSLPLLLSSLFSGVILFSYLQKKSIILYFAEKFSKTPITQEEKAYIHNSTLFWFLIALINTLVHLKLLRESNLHFWLYYSSIGWYFLFIGAGVLQFLHRRYIFLRRSHG